MVVGNRHRPNMSFGDANHAVYKARWKSTCRLFRISTSADGEEFRIHACSRTELSHGLQTCRSMWRRHGQRAKAQLQIDGVEEKETRVRNLPGSDTGFQSVKHCGRKARLQYISPCSRALFCISKEFSNRFRVQHPPTHLFHHEVLRHRLCPRLRRPLCCCSGC